MREKRLSCYRAVFVFVLVILSVLFSRQAGLSQDAINLSGKYKGYNVILIILDALRPDHLSCYGYAKQTSPNIDALAKEGALFKNAFSQASYTLPSVTSIFTSVYPYSHGVTHILKDRVPDKIGTLAQVLSLYGYNTAWFGLVDDFHTGSAPELLKGFKEKYDLPMKRKDTKISDWVKEHQKGPFFFSVHFYSTHERFFPFIKFDNKFYRSIPKYFLEDVNNLEKRCWDNLQDALKNDYETVVSILGKDFVEKYLTRGYSSGDFNNLFYALQNEEQKIFLEKICSGVVNSFFRSLDKQRLLYLLSLLDSALYGVDKDMIGELVKELKKLNLYNDTIIIITADHGNEYKEHGNLFHGPWLYDEVMRVPLIFYLPGLKKSAVIKELAQSIDILPTVLDLLDIPIPHQAQGISLAGLIEGRKGLLRNEYVFCQGIPVGTLAIRSRDWKLIRKAQSAAQSEADSFDFMLFNLKTDPLESRNVFKDKPEVAGQLESRLEAWINGLVVYRRDDSEFNSGVGEETKERIKKTGYW